MSSVDERVVEMRFDNQQFESGVKTSIGTLGKLQNALKLGDSGKTFDTLGSSIKGIDTGLLSNGLSAITSKFSVLGTIGDQVIRRLTDGLMNLGSAAVRAVKSLTIDQIGTGFEKYTSKTEAVQTIMNATGKSIDEVNVVLDKLNYYTDETSYSFSDMVNSIGKFTGAGVGLERAETAMEGIANWAATAGVGPEKAASAFYNLSQAISAGALKMQDWKSLQNLNMSTKQFKETAISTALNLGVLKDKGNGVITTAKGMEVNFKNFDQTLASGWLTSEVLLSTLEKYADQTTDFGLKAYHAAQEAKTFKDAIGAVKDAVSTGWAQTWELIFGNYEEAKVLWTNVANEMIDFFGKGAEARNDMLKTWHDTGGYTAALETLKSAWAGVKNIADIVSDTFKEVFPPMTGEKLVDLTNKAKDLADRFKEFTTVKKLGPVIEEFNTAKNKYMQFREVLNEPVYANKNFKNLVDGFKGVLSAVSLAGKGVKAFFNSLSPTVGVLKNFGQVVLDTIGKVGRYITKLNESTDATNFFSKISEKMISIQNKIIDIFGKVKDKFSDFGSGIKNIGSKIKDFIKNGLDKLKEAFGGLFDGFDLKNGLTILASIGGILATINIGRLIEDIIEKIKGPFKAFTGLVNQVTDTLGTLSDAFYGFGVKVSSGALVKASLAIALLAASILALGTVKTDNLVKGLLGIGTAMLSVVAMFALLGKWITPQAAKGISKLSGTLIAMGASILLLSIALKQIASIDSGALTSSVGALILLMASLTVASIALSKLSGDAQIGALGMIGMAAAVLVLSTAVKSLASIDSGFTQGLLGTIALLAALTGAGIAMSQFGGNLVGAAVGMIGMAASMLILSESVKKLGALDLGSLGKGIGSITALLAVLAAFSQFSASGGKMVALAAALLGVSAAMTVFSSVIGTLGAMDLGSLAKGVGTIGVVLLELVLALNAMSGAIGGAAALIIAAGAIAIFTPAIAALGQLELSQIGVALLALAGTFAVVGVAGLLLGPLAVPILALAAALLVIAAAIAVAGAGFTLLATGLTALAGSVAVTVSAIVSSVEMLITGLASIASSLVSSIAEIVSAIANGFAMAVPAVVSAVLQLILGIMNALVQYAPLIAAAGAQLIIGLLNTIASYAGPLAEAGLNLIISLINGMANAVNEKGAELLAAFGNLLAAIIGFLGEAIARLVALIPGVGEKMAEMVRRGTEAIKSELTSADLGAAGEEAANSLVEGASSVEGDLQSTGEQLGTSLVEGVEEQEGAANEAGQTLSMGTIEGFASLLGDANSSGGAFSTEMITGFLSNAGDATTAGQSLSSGTLDGLSGLSGSMQSVGSNGGAGLVRGLISQVGNASGAGAKLGAAAASGARGALQVKSPSRIFRQIGEYSGEGFCIGINQMLSDVSESTEKLGNTAIENISDSMKSISDYISSDVDSAPVITPVLDLSAIKNGKNEISNYLNGPIPLGINSNIFPNSNSAANIAELIEIGKNIIEEIQNGKDLYFDDGAFAGRINRRLGVKI